MGVSCCSCAGDRSYETVAPGPGDIADVARSGNVDVLRSLLQQGADMNKALEVSVWTGQIDCLQALLDSGASIDWKDPCDNGLLHHAADACQIEVVETLLKFKADPLAENGNYRRASDKTRDRRVLEILLKAEMQATEEKKTEENSAAANYDNFLQHDDTWNESKETSYEEASHSQSSGPSSVCGRVGDEEVRCIDDDGDRSPGVLRGDPCENGGGLDGSGCEYRDRCNDRGREERTDSDDERDRDYEGCLRRRNAFDKVGQLRNADDDRCHGQDEEAVEEEAPVLAQPGAETAPAEPGVFDADAELRQAAGVKGEEDHSCALQRELLQGEEPVPEAVGQPTPRPQAKAKSMAVFGRRQAAVPVASPLVSAGSEVAAAPFPWSTSPCETEVSHATASDLSRSAPAELKKDEAVDANRQVQGGHAQCGGQSAKCVAALKKNQGHTIPQSATELDLQPRAHNQLVPHGSQRVQACLPQSASIHGGVTSAQEVQKKSRSRKKTRAKKKAMDSRGYATSSSKKQDPCLTQDPLPYPSRQAPEQAELEDVAVFVQAQEFCMDVEDEEPDWFTPTRGEKTAGRWTIRPPRTRWQGSVGDCQFRCRGVVRPGFHAG